MRLLAGRQVSFMATAAVVPTVQTNRPTRTGLSPAALLAVPVAWMTFFYLIPIGIHPYLWGQVVELIRARGPAPVPGNQGGVAAAPEAESNAPHTEYDDAGQGWFETFLAPASQCRQAIKCQRPS